MKAESRSLPHVCWLAAGWLLALLVAAGPVAAQPARPAPLPADSLNAAVTRLREAGQYRAGVATGQPALAVARAGGRRQTAYATALDNLARLHLALGDYAAAGPLCRASRAATRHQAATLAGSLAYAQALENLGRYYQGRDQHARAERTYRQALALRRQHLGGQHPATARSLTDLAALRQLMGYLPEADSLAQLALAVFRSQPGPAGRDYARTLLTLGSIREQQDRTAAAVPLDSEAVVVHRQLGATHPDYALALTNLGWVYFSLERYAEAEPLYQEALASYRQQLGEASLAYVEPLNNLAALYQRQQRYAEAEKMYRQVLAIQQRAGVQLDYAITQHNLAGLLRTQERYDEAEALYKSALAIKARLFGRHHVRYAATLSGLAQLYGFANRDQEADARWAEVLRIERKGLGEQHTVYQGSLLDAGGHYEATSRYAEAEQLYRQAVAASRPRRAEQPQAYLNSLHRLAGLYLNHQAIAQADVKARAVYAEVLATARQQWGPDAEKYASVLDDTAYAYETAGYYTDAEPLYRQALAVYQRQAAGQARHQQVLRTLARFYGTLERYDQADSLYGQVLALRRAQVGEQDTTYANALNDAALLAGQRSRYGRADTLLRQALAVYQRAYPTKPVQYVFLLGNLGGVCENTGRYAEAEALTRSVLDIQRQALGARHADYLKAANRLASVYETMGRYPQAEALRQEVLATVQLKVGAQSPAYAMALRNLASLYVLMGRYEEAEPRYLQALATLQHTLGERDDDYTSCLVSLAVLYEKLGRFAEAEARYKQEMAISRQQYGEQHSDYASSLSVLGNLYQTMGRYAEAEAAYRQAQGIRRQALGPDHPDYASSLNDLADLYYDQHRYAEAEPLDREALAIRGRQLGVQNPLYAQSLNNLANLLESLKRYEESERLHREALGIYRQQYGEQHPEYANSLNNLAALYNSTGRYREAEPLYQQALAVKKRYYGEQNPDYARTLNNLALLHANTGHPAEALAYNTRATAILLRYLRSTFSGLSEREQQQLLATVAGSVERGHSFMRRRGPAVSPADLGQTYDNLLFTKGLLLASATGTRHRVLASADTTLVRRYGQWQATRHQLATARALPPDQQQARGLDPARLDEQANQLEKTLTASSAAFRQGAGLPTATWQQVQRALRPGEVAVELVRHRWYGRRFTDTICYSAYLLAPGSAAPRLVALPAGPALESRYLPAYRRLTHAAHADGRGLVLQASAADTARLDAQALYRAFWQPLAAALPVGTRTVYLSADGAYQQLNLATLQNPATGRYLLDELDVRLLGSTRELLPAARPAPAAPPTTAGILLGAPAYRLSAGAAPVAPAAAPADSVLAFAPVRSAYSHSDAWLAAGEVPPLPGTAREVTALDTLFARARQAHQLYTGPAATEELLRDLHRPRVLHIATHGFFVPETPAAPTAAAADPLLRSGLLLAGVSNFRDAKEKPATEDGILTAYEAALLDLQGTELVVLSACETGLGQVQNGEGVYGLQRGFTVAGARSILMSLWKVDDAVTQQLMVAFYKSWLGGSTKRAALLQAQQQVRATHPEPYYWGAFVLVGE